MPWQPGQSGNRAGRPKGFAGVARMIMRETHDGAELVQWALDVWRDPQRAHAERERAHAWLSDRCLGKPLQQAQLLAVIGHANAPSLPIEWDSWSLEQRRHYLDRLRADAIGARPTLPVVDAESDDDE